MGASHDLAATDSSVRTAITTLSQMLDMLSNNITGSVLLIILLMASGYFVNAWRGGGK